MKKLIFILLISMLVLSCTKESDHESSGDIYISNPVTGENFAGLKFKIIETETKYNSISSEVIGTKVVCEGVTDQAGHADFSIRFKRKYRRLFAYTIEFDKSNIDAVPGQYYDDIPAFDVLHDGNNRKYEFHYLRYGNYVRQFKNVNCFDENDKIEFKVLEAYTGGYSNFDNVPFWGGGNLQYEGCIDWTQSIVNAPSNVYYYQLKVTRNGVYSIYYDTFVNNPGVTDTFEIFY